MALKYIEEVQHAPRDAINSLLGLSTTFQILALVRYEFKIEPLRVVIRNWLTWSHQLWSWILLPFDIEVPVYFAGIATLTALIALMMLRAQLRHQDVERACYRQGRNERR